MLGTTGATVLLAVSRGRGSADSYGTDAVVIQRSQARSDRRVGLVLRLLVCCALTVAVITVLCRATGRRISPRTGRRHRWSCGERC